MPQNPRSIWRVIAQLLTALLPLLIKKSSQTARRSSYPKDTLEPPPPLSSPPVQTPSPPKAAPKPKAKKSRRRRKPVSPVGNAFKAKKSDVIVTDQGLIVKVLRDDLVGSRHQRFLIEIDHTDVTVKLAHNIDLAPRIPASEGDRVEFRGEYEYNDLGGAVHWTHLDPKGWHEHGYVEHNDKRYE